MLTPRPHQVKVLEAFAQELPSFGAVADASETGTGKTYVTAVLAARLGFSLFVVCPKAVMPSWRNVAELGGVPCKAINYEKIRTGKQPEYRLNKVGRTKVGQWKLPPKTLLVFDEAQNLGGQKSLNSLLCVAAADQRIPTVVLSATLFDSPLKAKAIAYLFKLHRMFDYTTWCGQHGCRKGFFGGIEFVGDIVGKDKRGHNIHSKTRTMDRIRAAIGPRLQRVLKKDVPGFPANFVDVLTVDTEAKDPWTEKAEKKLKEAMTPMTALLHERQIAELGKVPAMAERAQDLHEEGRSVALFVSFTDSRLRLVEALGDCAQIHGDQTGEEREAERLRFQNNEVPYIVVMLQAGGAGLELHDKLRTHPRAAVISPSFSAVELLQALGRIHRDGGTDVVQYLVFAEDHPAEKRIARRVKAKIACLEALNDSDLDVFNTKEPMPNQDQPIQGTPAAGLPPSPATPAERQHAPCGPSTLKNREICPNWRSDKPAPVHVVTQLGTDLHAVMEQLVEKPDLGTNIETSFPTLDADSVKVVEACWAFVGPELKGALEVTQEQRVDTHEPQVWGYYDLRIRKSRRKTLFVDYKFGFNAVDDPEVNPQAWAYSLAEFLEFPEVEEVDFVFLLPRLDLALLHTFRRTDVAAMKLRISTIVARVNDGTLFNPQPAVCQYCGYKAKCPKLAEKALLIAKNYATDGLEVPAEFHPSQIKDPVVMAKALILAGVLEEWCGSVKHHAHLMRFDQGIDIPGFEVKSRAGRRKVTDTVGAWHIARELGVTEDEFVAASTVSLTDLVKAVREHTPAGTTKKAREELFDDRLKDAGAVTRDVETLYLARKKPALPA